MLFSRGTGVFSTVTEHLHRLKRDAQTDAQAALIAEYISQLQVSTLVELSSRLEVLHLPQHIFF